MLLSLASGIVEPLETASFLKWPPFCAGIYSAFTMTAMYISPWWLTCPQTFYCHYCHHASPPCQKLHEVAMRLVESQTAADCNCNLDNPESGIYPGTVTLTGRGGGGGRGGMRKNTCQESAMAGPTTHECNGLTSREWL